MKKFLANLVMGLVLVSAIPCGEALAAKKQKNHGVVLKDSNRAALAAQARKICRDKFGPGVTFQGFDSHKGKIIKIWCF